MSDNLINRGQAGKPRDGGGADDRHEAARNVAEAAVRAERTGDADRAEALLEQAQNIDPDAVLDVVQDRPDVALPTPADDEELATMSEMVRPNSDAPPRAGIGGSGSGADNQGL